MKAVALVPVGRLSAAKTRLSRVLTPVERSELTLWMLGQVIEALRSSGRLARIYAVTPDETVLRTCKNLGIRAIHDGGRGLNAALESAIDEVATEPVSACLTVLADLPFLAGSEIDEMFTLATEVGSSVAAPDKLGTGTNGLLLLPARALPFRFGPRSLSRYRDAAREAGVELATYLSPGTSFDVDEPEDLVDLETGLDATGSLYPYAPRMFAAAGRAADR